MIDFFAAGEPAPQPRPRACAMRMQGKWTARIYNPDTADAWKMIVRLAAIEAIRGRISAGPLRVCLRFFLSRPESHFNRAGLRPGAPLYHTNERADIDNLVKAVMDAITDAGVWDGDGQVAQLYAEKLYARSSEPTGCRILVTKIIAEHAPASLFQSQEASPV